MARKIKFALELKDGAMVRRNLDELREHFDMEKVVGHFLSGKLVKWLEDRYYDDEVAKVDQINKDDPYFHRQLCAVLGVEYTGGEDLDVEQLERLNEKRRILQEMTDDEEIIDNAAETAFNQEDLADLLDMDTPTIYLCGENFTVPVRVKNKKYIGILSTPKISITAVSEETLKERNIEFNNVILPFSGKKEESEEIKITDSLEKAKEYFRKAKKATDENEKMDLFLNAAQNGHIESMIIVGQAYIRGDILPKDSGLGISWLENAATLGYVKAIRFLRNVYKVGYCDIKPNKQKEKFWENKLKKQR